MSENTFNFKTIKSNILGQLQQLGKILKTNITSERNEENISKMHNNISRFANSQSRNIFNDLVSSLYAKNNQSISGFDTKEILKDFGVMSSPETDRIARYDIYEEIVEKISYAKRALKVIKDNIISPDDYSFGSLKVVYKKEDRNNDDLIIIKKNFESILNKFNINDNADEIIESTLWYGDYFVELVVIDEELKKRNLMESCSHSTSYISENIRIHNLETDTIEQQKVNIKLITVQENNISVLANKNEKPINNNVSNNLYLQYYSPRRVVRIGNDPCFGYLLFPSFGRPNVNFLDAQNLVSTSVKSLLNKLTAKLKLPNSTIQDLQSKPEFLKLLTQLVLQSEEAESEKSIRYIPPDNIVHFRLDSIKNSPYGQSIFFGQEFLAKIMILIETTIAIQRIRNASEKVIIGVEIGLPRDAKNIIEEMKTKFKRKRYSIDNIGTIKDIPSAISTFEDIYLPMKDGKKFVEFDTLNNRGNMSDNIEDLKLMRDIFIAGLTVPPAFLSVEENLESKATLTQQNILFARDIMNYQRAFSKMFTELVSKLHKLTYTDIKDSSLLKEISVTFTKPKSLKLELDSEYYNSLSSLADNLNNLGVPKEYIIKKFLKDDIDPDALETLRIENKISSVLNANKGEEQEMSGGGY